MTYPEFTNIFLPKLASSYRDGKLPFHGLIDFDLWKRVFPDANHRADELQWSAVHFNAFVLDDEERSLLIVLSFPELKTKNEAKFVCFRLNNNRKKIALYYLRRPLYHDQPWLIHQYDYKAGKDYYITELMGADSLREFINAIKDIAFQENVNRFTKYINVFRD